MAAVPVQEADTHGNAEYSTRLNRVRKTEIQKGMNRRVTSLSLALGAALRMPVVVRVPATLHSVASISLGPSARTYMTLSSVINSKSA